MAALDPEVLNVDDAAKGMNFCSADFPRETNEIDDARLANGALDQCADARVAGVSRAARNPPD